MYTMVQPLQKAPDKITYIEIDYENGDPVALNGEKLSSSVLLKRLNKIAGEMVSESRYC